jgi:hypothetical protein
LAVKARQHYPVSREIRYRVERDEAEYLVWEDDRPWHRDGSADRVLIELFRRVYAMVYAGMPGCPRLHAGSAAYHGRVFLAVGAKGAGKSTLMTRLLFDGVEVFGDEMVLGLGHDVIALPRRFHLKAPGLNLLPGVAAIADRLPFVMADAGHKIIAFDPTEAGRPWTIRRGRPEAIFFLEANHGGRTELAPCPKVDMIQALMTQSLLDGQDGGAWIRALGTLVRGAECYNLRIGDLSSATAMMKRALQQAVPPDLPQRSSSWQTRTTT